MNEVNHQLDQLSSRIVRLEERISKLEEEAGEDYVTFRGETLPGFRDNPYFGEVGYRVSAMDAIRLLMEHLGLKFNHIRSQPARTELVQETAPRPTRKGTRT